MDLVEHLSNQFSQNYQNLMNGGLSAGIGGAQSTMPKSFGLDLYHGSSSKFNVFDVEKSRAGSAGTGIYLTPEKSLAERFGENIYTTYVPYSEKQIMKFDQPVFEQHPSIQKSIENISKKHGIEIDPSQDAKYLYAQLVDKIKSNNPDIDHSEAAKMATQEMQSVGIKGSKFQYGDKDAYAIYKDKGLDITGSSSRGEISIKPDPSKIESAKEMAKNIGRYYATHPAELAKTAGKGLATGAVGAGLEYGLQKAVPVPEQQGYWGDVERNLRNVGIAGASGAVGGPLGSAVSIAAENGRQIYETGKEAAELYRYKKQSPKIAKE